MIRTGQAAHALMARLRSEKGNLMHRFDWGVGKRRIFLKVRNLRKGNNSQILTLALLFLVLLVELRLQVAYFQLGSLVSKRKAFHPLLQKLYNSSIAQALVVLQVGQTFSADL